VEKIEEIKKKYNILVQEYSHGINLSTSLREKRDKFTIVLHDYTLIPELKAIKQQHPKTIFILINSDKK
jgi:hypothetical protein